MKIVKALVTGSLLISFTAFAGDAFKVIPVSDKYHPSSFYVGTVCLGGYLHSYATKATLESSVRLTQMYKEDKSPMYPNKPIKC